MNIAEEMVQSLEEKGVRYLFGVPGEENIDFLEAVRNSSIQFILTRHEQTAAMMAAMVGRLTGIPGVCLSTLGPGAVNLATGVATANADGLPLIAIAGQAETNRLHHPSHQMVDLPEFFRPITKWSTTIRHSSAPRETIEKAFNLAMSEKPGAVFIELPEDLAVKEGDSVTGIASALGRVEAAEIDMKRAAEQINAAEMPLILAGAGTLRGKASREVAALSEKLCASVLETFMGKGAVSWRLDTHLAAAGTWGRDWADEAIDKADLVLAIGYDYIEYSPVRWNKERKQVVHINWQEAEVDAHYPVVASLIGDLSCNLARLTELVRERTALPAPFAELRRKIRQEWEEAGQDTAFPLKPSKILYDLRAAMNDDDLVVCDVGAHKVWLGRMFPVFAPDTCFISNGLATMGVALPGAIAAKLVKPERRVVAVCGDGGFLMNVQDLETAARLKLPLVILLWRDGGYGLIEWKQLEKFRHSHHVTFGNPDFVHLARSFGIEGCRVEKGEELRPLLEKALHAEGPVLIDCPVDYRENLKLEEKIRFGCGDETR
ncbi:acetolactate synthase large subunit [Thermoactinomyces sp. CICC 10523]|uniref:acetolactate synthase large subunit n=1 Tax=Thermoactinomyces sp. CICC 10523 TaxID=2767428 RepID=UPI0018DD8066|nr:acetolactate synthase large subunit [Thermoactinomyces sp. CICC 10523]MBH8597800.1 acetolactate synthase large subunit [Thermoactinomyces sp. CICC 10523]